MADGNLNLVADRILKLLGSGSVAGVYQELLQGLEGTISNKLSPVLLDAEHKSQSDYRVRDWLMELEDVLYYADNLLDDFSIEAPRLLLMTGNKNAKQVLSDFFSYMFKINMRWQEIKQVRKRLDEMADKEEELCLMACSGTRVMEPTEITINMSRNQTRSAIDEGDLRKDDKMAIIRILLHMEFMEDVEVLPIVGRTGLGKTTLAEDVFNDEGVQSHFHIRIWVSVSEKFYVEQILKDILGETGGKVEDLRNDDKLRKLLTGSLSGKRYLIVLDDWQNEDPSKWHLLKDILKVGASGSKILVTTRSERVADLIKGNSIPYPLSDLNEEQSWILFEKIAFGPEQEDNIEDQSDQVRIGRAIVQRCAGSPLVIMPMASMLRIEKWRIFRRTEAFGFTPSNDQDDEIMKLLKLCYYYLPFRLKHCFAYCSLFPKGHEIDVQTLIKLWMAQDFIEQSEKSLEDVGYEYFLHLFERYFFEEVKRDAMNRITICKMHKLMHALAMSVTGDLCRLISSPPANYSIKRTLHLWFDFDLTSTEDITKFEAKRIRSIVLSGQSRRKYRGIPVDKIFDKITSKFRFVRALDMHASGIEIVPYSIGKLKLLKYLDLSENEEITELPNSITKLQNLQTLRLSLCFKLKKLPREFRKLVKLRHLEIDGCNNLISLPRGIGELPDLQTVSQLVVSEDSSMPEVVVNKLRELTELIGKLTIRNLRLKNLRHENDVATYLSEVPSGVRSLSLEWEGHEPETKYDQTPLNRNLSLDLEDWSIIGFRGIALFCPHSPFPSNLVRLSLSRCANCTYLPLVHQLSSLKILVLDNLTDLEYILAGDSSSTTFLPILEELWLTELPKLLGWWQNTGDNLPVFDRLSKLVIEDCPNLVSMPRFPNLEKGLVLDRTCWKLFELTVNENTADQEEPPLSKLKNLRIVGIKEFKADNIKWAILKNNLQFLRFDSLPELKTLPEGLQEVINLQELHVWRCPIKEIPKWIKKLENLKTLVIRICPHLEKLPEEISSLKIQKLEIDDCNTLLRRCESEIGADWDKISSIPRKQLGRITRR